VKTTNLLSSSPVIAPEYDGRPTLELTIPESEDLELPKSGTMVVSFEVIRETEDHEAKQCRYSLRITEVDKVRKLKSPEMKVKTAAEAMEEEFDRD